MRQQNNPIFPSLSLAHIHKYISLSFHIVSQENIISTPTQTNQKHSFLLSRPNFKQKKGGVNVYIFFFLLSSLRSSSSPRDQLFCFSSSSSSSSMNTAQWPQEIGLVKPMEEIVTNTCSRPIIERKARPQKEQVLNCPRCHSTNTKFCYYNNYSLTQPRYFCKTCRRYWTEGGSLRNVPVGGGSRKNKRSSNTSSSSPSTSATASSKKLHDHLTTSQSASQNPKIHEGQDLNLGFSIPESAYNHAVSHEYGELPTIENNHSHNNASSTSTSLSALELLRTGMTSRGLNSFMPMPPVPVPDSNTNYSSSSGFAMQDFKPTLNFGLDGLGGGSGYGSNLHHHHHHHQGVQENGGRLLFPFEDLRQVSSTSDQFEQNRGQGDSTGYWSGMLGGGSW